MRILSFDIEEWGVAQLGGYGTTDKYAEYDSFLNGILDLLSEQNTKATFFCTGLIAECFPQVIKLIQSHGHEIGCHSYAHSRLDKMSLSQARNDTRKAVDAIEQCIGEKVLCYRAPAFSITESNKWMFEVLYECGIRYDASIFPVKRDFGGYPTFGTSRPCLIEYNGIILKEFPINTTRLLGRDVIFTGGGYFRITPRSFIKKHILSSDYSICYFHINDFLKEISPLKSRSEYERYFKESGSLMNRYKRYFKANVGKTNAWSKLAWLVQSYEFSSILSAEKKISWSDNVVTL